MNVRTHVHYRFMYVLQMDNLKPNTSRNMQYVNYTYIHLIGLILNILEKNVIFKLSENTCTYYIRHVH